MHKAFSDYVKTHHFGDVHIKVDVKTGLYAIIAIHNTQLGPALGGCRCLTYENMPDPFDGGLWDALRLAEGMSYKAAVVGIPHGGGKAVLVRPAEIKDRKAYFEAFGRFVHELGGRYITAIDSGSDVSDMDIIQTQTPYVTSVSSMKEDTSLYTANGVLHGIEAALEYRFQSKSLENRHVAIQGLGHVGYHLARELHQRGARLSLSEVRKDVLARAVHEFNATAVDGDAIYEIEADVFSPCALGAIINENTLTALKAPIIAGAANNQLKNERMGHELQERGILYAPDYVINAGGLIYAASCYDGADETQIQEKLASINQTLMHIFKTSERENMPSSEVADAIAKQRLGITDEVSF